MLVGCGCECRLLLRMQWRGEKKVVIRLGSSVEITVKDIAKKHPHDH